LEPNDKAEAMATPARKSMKTESETASESLNGWTRKRRTMLRFIRPGDVFCFTRNDGAFYFGQIISKALVGHCVQIFDVCRHAPEIGKSELQQAQAKVSIPPIILDSYAIFDRKVDDHGDWRVIGKLETGDISRFESYFFCYGGKRNWKKINAMGSDEQPIPDEAAMTLEPLIALTSFKFWLSFDAFRASGSKSWSHQF